MPNGIVGHRVPDFTNSLDACFKWLIKNNWSITINMGQTFVVAMITIPYGKGIYGSSVTVAKDKTPALALCPAIEKLINLEAKPGR